MPSNETLINEIKWEMALILAQQSLLAQHGRKLDYTEEDRLKTLRNRLDQTLGLYESGSRQMTTKDLIEKYAKENVETIELSDDEDHHE